MYPNGGVNAQIGGLSLEKSIEFSRALVAEIKRARVERGVSQERLAKMAGLSQSAIAMIESGDRNPTLFVVHALTIALEVDLSVLIASVKARSSSDIPKQ